jgi:hypothetical protein
MDADLTEVLTEARLKKTISPVVKESDRRCAEPSGCFLLVVRRSLLPARAYASPALRRDLPPVRAFSNSGSCSFVPLPPEFHFRA